MDSISFRALLQKGNSKKIALQIIEEIRIDPARMEELMANFFDEDLRICQRASWPVGLIADHNPQWILPYIEKMLLNLDSPHHDAVIRNTFRSLQTIDMPEEVEGLAFEKAFNFLVDPQNAVAIRVFAMTVCCNIAIKYPDLRHELIPVIEEQMPHGTAGFKSRGSRLLKRLNS